MRVQDKIPSSELLLKMYSNNQLRFLYRGALLNSLGIILYKGLSFFLYEKLLLDLEAIFRSKSSLIHGLSAAMAVAVVQMLVYPLDLVKKRIIVLETPKVELFKEMKAPYLVNGFIKGYYKGFSINLIKGPLANAASFATRDYLRSFSNKEF